ncbi:MAG: gamma-glutamylcyclotransferase, partial [Methanobrevibacter sp.]|nr:gamma-glutamylcyclotransferase [Methanobrevibacter sp.]
IISLGKMDGYEMLTITNEDIRDYNDPCDEYLDTLKKGMRENWSEMSQEDINSYLEGCIRE